jgi:hypothetical protein
MEKNLVEILISKEFDELNDSERNLMDEWCKNKEEFVKLKSLFIQVDSYKMWSTKQPDSKIKHLLIAIFKEERQNKNRIFWNFNLFALLFPKNKSFYQQPAIYVVAIIAILFGTKSLFEFDRSNPPKFAANIPSVKEIKVQSKPIKNKLESIDAPKKTAQKVNSKIVERTERILPNKNIVTKVEEVSEDNLLDSYADDYPLNIAPVSEEVPLTVARNVDFDNISIVSSEQLKDQQFKPITIAENPEILDFIYAVY